jgi:HAMP domain-containing protein
LFTDFEGKEIASNGVSGFTEADLAWLRARIDSGDERAALQAGPNGDELIGVNLLRYSRTRTPEGALMYKVRLADLKPVPWAGFARAGRDAVRGSPPPVRDRGRRAAAGQPGPPGLQLREDERRLPLPLDTPAPQYLLIIGITAVLALVVFLLASRLALGLTRDLRRLESLFARSLGDDGISRQRAPLEGSREVVSLAGSLNRMLDRLYGSTRTWKRSAASSCSCRTTSRNWCGSPTRRARIVWFNDRWYEFTGAAPGEGMHRRGASTIPTCCPRCARAGDETLSGGQMAR